MDNVIGEENNKRLKLIGKDDLKNIVEKKIKQLVDDDEEDEDENSFVDDLGEKEDNKKGFGAKILNEFDNSQTDKATKSEQ